ncbi:hypothetical protein Tco_1312045 [Tanacetum coccineum]
MNLPTRISRDLTPHLKYAFLEGENKLPVIIAKELSVEEQAALIKVLKSHKQAIAWKLSDINPEFYTYKILMEEDYKPTVQHQRWVNLKIHDVIKKEVFRKSFKNCISQCNRFCFKGAKETNLFVLMGKRVHFMVKEGIFIA